MKPKKYLKFLMQEERTNQPSLFPKYEKYRIDVDERGIPWGFKNMTAKDKSLVRMLNMHLLVGLDLTIPNQFPMLDAYNEEVEDDFVAFSERKKTKNKDKSIHFFSYDYLFDKAIWEHPEKLTYELVHRPCIIGPDYSIYVDAPECINKYNIYKSRLMSAHWARCGGKVIPCAGFGNATSISYAFEGLPSNSVIACCGVGHNYNPLARKLWEYGLRALEEQKNPTQLLIYGPECKVPGLHTPIKFITDQITKFHR